MIQTTPRRVVIGAMSLPQPKSILNFFVTGQVRAGSNIVRTALSSHDRCHCHGDLLHAENRIREKAHARYFVDDHERCLEYCQQGLPDGRSNPERYLTHTVFDHALHDEAAIGVRLLYPCINQGDLWSYLAGRWRDGDFCCVHVVRNPLACFASQKQVEASSGRFFRGRTPVPVRLDLDEFITFARQHEMDRGKIRAICEDVYEVAYSDLLFNLDETLRGICRFLELRWTPSVRPTTTRAPNRLLRMRITNFDELALKAPHSMRRYFTDDLV